MHYKLMFDGGARNNGRPNATVYGSFLVVGGHLPPVTQEFPGYTTNNEAEILSATAALQSLCGQADPSKLEVELWGDSKLAVNCLAGRWKIKKPHLQTLAARFKAVSRLFKSVTLHWQPRAVSVAHLGH